MIDVAARAALRARAQDAIGAVIARSDRWVMSDFPRHANVGDSLIFQGQRALMRERGAVAAYVFDRRYYDRRAVDAAEAPIMIHGGGNFGDLYRTHHELRKTVLRNHRDRAIVQMPQSIRFEDRAELEQTRRLVSDHGRMTIMVRDRPSYEFATANFEAEVLLTPDAALALAPFSRTGAPVGDVIWQARVDKEAADRDGSEPVPTFDWLEPPRTVAARRRLARLEAALRVAAKLPLVRNQTTIYDRYAEFNRVRGIEYFSAGRVLVTDRLHGHVLACLIGMPHVVIGDRYGKIRNLWDLWTGELGALWATDRAQAAELAQTLLQR